MVFRVIQCGIVGDAEKVQLPKSAKIHDHDDFEVSYPICLADGHIYIKGEIVYKIYN